MRTRMALASLAPRWFPRKLNYSRIKIVNRNLGSALRRNWFPHCANLSWRGSVVDIRHPRCRAIAVTVKAIMFGPTQGAIGREREMLKLRRVAGVLPFVGRRSSREAQAMAARERGVFTSSRGVALACQARSSARGPSGRDRGRLRAGPRRPAAGDRRLRRGPGESGRALRSS